MYIHGGRDLKEGAVPTMWRVNLTALQQLHGGVQKPVCWEQVQTSGRDIGRISHHKCAMISAKEVAFFGGLRADTSGNCVSILNLANNTWQNCNVKVSFIAFNHHTLFSWELSTVSCQETTLQSLT